MQSERRVTYGRTGFKIIPNSQTAAPIPNRQGTWTYSYVTMEVIRELDENEEEVVRTTEEVAAAAERGSVRRRWRCGGGTTGWSRGGWRWRCGGWILIPGKSSTGARHPTASSSTRPTTRTSTPTPSWGSPKPRATAAPCALRNCRKPFFVSKNAIKLVIRF